VATELQHADLLDAQARYVDLFDRSRSLSLNPTAMHSGDRLPKFQFASGCRLHKRSRSLPRSMRKRSEWAKSDAKSDFLALKCCERRS